MATSPGKRSPRKHGAKAAGSAPAEPRGPAASPLVDPEAVAAVRHATAKAARMLHLCGRGLARGSLRAGRWLGPRLVRVGRACAKGLGRAVGASVTWLWGHRGGLARAGHRGLWWAALAILILVGRALLAADGDPELVEAAMLWFGAGLSMSVLVLIGAPEPRMRVAAFALASGHGSLAALAWIAIAGA